MDQMKFVLPAKKYRFRFILMDLLVSTGIFAFLPLIVEAIRTGLGDFPTYLNTIVWLAYITFFLISALAGTIFTLVGYWMLVFLKAIDAD